MSVTAIRVEPCPEHLRRLEQPCYGGSLFFNLEEGRAGCGNPECGWSGVPVSRGGVLSTWCPKCQPEALARSEDLDAAVVRSLEARQRQGGAKKRKAARAARRKNRR